MIPTLLKPRLYFVKNRWHSTVAAEGQWTRDILITVLAAGVMCGMYFGGLWTLRQTEGVLDFAYLHPSTSLGLVLVFLFFMLLVSNTVAALGTLFLGKDLVMLISSPLTALRFFGGKYLEIIATSSWRS